MEVWVFWVVGLLAGAGAYALRQRQLVGVVDRARRLAEQQSERIREYEAAVEGRQILAVWEDREPDIDTSLYPPEVVAKLMAGSHRYLVTVLNLLPRWAKGNLLLPDHTGTLRPTVLAEALFGADAFAGVSTKLQGLVAQGGGLTLESHRMNGPCKKVETRQLDLSVALGRAFLERSEAQAQQHILEIVRDRLRPPADRDAALHLLLNALPDGDSTQDALQTARSDPDPHLRVTAAIHDGASGLKTLEKIAFDRALPADVRARAWDAWAARAPRERLLLLAEDPTVFATAPLIDAVARLGEDDRVTAVLLHTLDKTRQGHAHGLAERTAIRLGQVGTLEALEPLRRMRDQATPDHWKLVLEGALANLEERFGLALNRGGLSLAGPSGHLSLHDPES